ncbi:MAG TPA: transcriptional regulator [Microbacteriaceae bacterium]|jgi:DNA-binding IclR family transcriptional regulator|nr:transcriptional regulator [Microbacteriaceae bacterium]
MTSAPDHIADVRARQPKAIHSALVVLEEVARCGPGVTAREVSQNLGFPRATTYRLLNLLVQEEYLVRLADLSGFALGTKVAQLVGSSGPARPPQAARDVIDGLRSRIRGGIHLARYDESRLRVVDVDPDFPLSNPARVERFIDASAMGRLLLLELDEAGIMASASIERPTAEVAALLRDTRARGYAVQLGELTPGYGCLAVPIRDTAGALVAGLCFSSPLARVERPGDVLEHLHDGSRVLAPLLA